MATKRIPYGVSDFQRFSRENYYYVDKTRFIGEVEKSPSFLFLIRPRRFGKSLWLSMLELYYDMAMKDKFEELFGRCSSILRRRCVRRRASGITWRVRRRCRRCTWFT